MFWRPPCMNPGERRLRHIWVKNYKPTPIETYRNPADRLCMAGIGNSNFHLADFGFGRLLQLSPLGSNFAQCTFTLVPTQFESRLYSIFFRAGSIFNWNYILYTSFFIYILSKAQQRTLLLYMYNMIYKYNDLKILRLNSKFFNQIMFY